MVVSGVISESGCLRGCEGVRDGVFEVLMIL